MTTPDDLHKFQGTPSAEGADTFARGRPAEHPWALLYQGPWETLGDGTCVAVRRHARALAATGVPVLLKSFAHVVSDNGRVVPVHEAGLDPAVRAEAGALSDTSAATIAGMVKHVVPRDGQHLRSVLFPLVGGLGMEQLAAIQRHHARLTVLYTVWERDRVPADVARILSRAAECWVPCTQNEQALVKSGVPADNVRVMPHPFDPDSRLAQDGPRRTGREGPPRFYSIGIWQPRKGLHELLGAFLRAWPEQDGASLTIKAQRTEWPGYPTIEQSLDQWLADERVRQNGWTSASMKGRVRVVTRRLTDAEMTDLHLSHDTYVSASHGEAWSLPAFDAKVAGNRLVHVPWGGTADFSDALDVSVPFRLGPVHESYRWEQGTQWAEWEPEALEEALRRASAPSDFSRSRRLDRLFSMESVGRRMVASLMPIVERTSAEAALWLRERIQPARIEP